MKRSYLKSLYISPLNKMLHRVRFLDDIWGAWQGCTNSFHSFLEAVNSIGSTYGITFTGECDKTVQFLDVTTSLDEGKLSTTMYVKPTDSTRYLNRRSFHNLSIPSLAYLILSSGELLLFVQTCRPGKLA